MTAVEVSDLGVLYIAFKSALSVQSPVPVWADRVYADSIPTAVSGTPVVRPYVIMAYAGGGDNNRIGQDDPELLVDVTCVAESTAAALSGASEIRRRLNDSGERDRRPYGYSVSGNGTWMISTVTYEQRIHIVELVDDGSTKLYHSGARLRAQLFRRY